MKKYLIYILTFPNNKVYIGQTNNFKGRMSCYRNLWCEQQPKLFNALKKYEWENIRSEVLLECDMEYVDFFERAFISGYNSMNKGYGYNLESGGSKNKIMSNESRQKMRNSQLGKKKSDEFKLKQSKRMSGQNHPMYGKKHTDATREKLSKGRIGKYVGENSPNFGIIRSDAFRQKISVLSKGRKMSEQQKAKISKSLTGRLTSDEHRKNLSIANMGKNTKPIFAYDTEGNFIKRFDSIRLASKELDVSCGYICKIAKGKKEFSHGYTFKYAC